MLFFLSNGEGSKVGEHSAHQANMSCSGSFDTSYFVMGIGTPIVKAEREELEQEGLVSTTPNPYARENKRVDRDTTLLARRKCRPKDLL